MSLRSSIPSPNLPVIIAILAVIFLVILVIIQVRTVALRGDCFIVDEGYEVISANNGYNGLICRNLETGIYRQCYPQIVECDE